MRPLRVITYNIHGGRGMDGRIDLERIADVIAPFEPDIVALQEVDVNRARSGGVDQTDVIGRRLGLEVRFGCTIATGGERYGIATLTRLAILETRQVALPWRTSDARSEPRCALLTRVAWGGIEVDMINTHLSVRIGERQGQVLELARWSGAEAAVTQIVAGDFNCTPWSRPYRTLRAGLATAASPRSWPSRLPVVPLDHILYRGRLRVVRSGIWRAPAAQRASDHLPVFAELGTR